MKTFDEGRVLHFFDELIRVDSTTGQYEMIQRKLTELLDEMGHPYKTIRKGGVIVDAGGKGEPLCIAAHVDDIGLMVRKINGDGTLNVCKVGGLHPFLQRAGKRAGLYPRRQGLYRLRLPHARVHPRDRGRNAESRPGFSQGRVRGAG